MAATEAPSPPSLRAVLFDLDGVFYVGDSIIPGGALAIEHAKSRGLSCRFLTNTTRHTREGIHEKTRRLGLPIEEAEIVSTVTAAVHALRERGRPRCRLVVCDDVRSEFDEFTAVEGASPVDVVVVGDIGNAWTYDLLNQLFRDVMAGAEILALHKGRYWMEPDGLRLDIGAFVAGLEFATGRTARVLGKPSPEFFRLALSSAGVAPASALMVGDDIVSDVGGAQRAGMRGVLVRTGKYRPDDSDRTGITPDLTIDSVADLPGIL
jgi:HAD superfamily hydrolase (TIGR01458 family)